MNTDAHSPQRSPAVSPTASPASGDLDWCGPLAHQLAALRAWRSAVNVMAVGAGLVLVGGVIAWLAVASI